MLVRVSAEAVGHRRQAIRVAFPKGYVWAAELDIADFCGSIDHDVVMSLVARRVSDGRTLKLIRGWLEAGVLVDEVWQETVSGTPQSGVISPLLANIVLHELDRAMGGIDGVFVRYADDRGRHVPHPGAGRADAGPGQGHPGRYGADVACRQDEGRLPAGRPGRL